MTHSPTALLLAAVLASAAVPALAVEPSAPEQLITTEMAFGLKVRQAIANAGGEVGEAEQSALDRFYAERGNVPVWIVQGAYGPRAKALMAELEKAGDWGMRPGDYAVPALATTTGSSALADGSLIDAEVKLSLAALRYAHDAHVGRIAPEQVSRIIDRGSTPPDPYEVIKALAGTDAPDKVLTSYQPKHPQFELLRQKYLALRNTSDSSAKDEVVIPDGPKLKPGQTHPQIALLRQRLDVPLPPEAKPEDANVYDDALLEAVRNFQSEHDLKADGIITKGLRQMLNGRQAGSSSAQAERLLVNMERWRWMKEDMGGFYVWNNLPEFVTRVMDGGKKAFEERIVIGKGSTPTPFFSDEMEYIEFMPVWSVPNSIKVQEILPSLRAGSDIMSVQNLRADYNGRPVDVYNVDWYNTDIRNFHFYQPPGGINVLGVVKFMFPNHFDVYMHDTPTKNLFGESVRAYSHGCMRVRNPLELAKVILGHDQGWSEGEVEAAARGGNRQVVLKTKIPVHITYFTAWVEPDGSVRTFGDWYGHDRRLALALNGKTQLIAAELAAEPKTASPEPGFWDGFGFGGGGGSGGGQQASRR